MKAIILFLAWVPIVSAADVASIARLVRDANPDASVITAALRSSDPLARATAARVAGVRDAKGALPALREVVAAESDAAASREEVRALALIGEAADVDRAIEAARKSGAEAAVVDAVARRGGEEAIGLYPKLRALAGVDGFFRLALWGRKDLIGPTAGRLLQDGDERGWRDLLDALFESKLGLPAERAAAALDSSSEEIRGATAWFLVRGYAADPSAVREPLRAKLLAARETPGNDREDFARELLRRMLGGEASNQERWLKWLATKEGDTTLPRDQAIYAWLTPRERAMQEPLPDKPAATPEVVQADFQLPGTLPPGLTGQLGKDLVACKWLGVTTATVDRAGRVQSVDLGAVQTSCKAELETIVKLSYATNASIASAMTTGNLLLAKDHGAAPCLDEAGDDFELHRAGGDVAVPKAKKRVEPHFPESARRAMPPGAKVTIVAECVITRAGCVRSVRLLKQSPYPELNAALVLAISKWIFEPGLQNGKPVDVVFAFSTTFSLH
jgi:TonB family protein